MSKEIRVIIVLQSLIINPTFIDRHRKDPSASIRNRKFSFGTVIATILHLAKRRLQIVCNQIGGHQMIIPASKQSFSQTRYKIPYTGFKALNNRLLEEVNQDEHEALWYGYRVFGIDGSTIPLPKSKETSNSSDTPPLSGNLNEVTYAAIVCKTFS